MFYDCVSIKYSRLQSAGDYSPMWTTQNSTNRSGTCSTPTTPLYSSNDCNISSTLFSFGVPSQLLNGNGLINLFIWNLLKYCLLVKDIIQMIVCDYIINQWLRTICWSWNISESVAALLNFFWYFSLLIDLKFCMKYEVSLNMYWENCLKNQLSKLWQDLFYKD